jgi:hypothetical protein
MLQLAEAFEGHDTFYFCYDADTTRHLENAYRVPNMARNPFEMAKNFARVTRIFLKERPDLIVSTGAEIAIPVVLVGKAFGVPAMYIECGAQVTAPSFTGKLMWRLADVFYVQWPELLAAYGPRAQLRGSFIDSVSPFPGDRAHEKRSTVVLLTPPEKGPKAQALPPLNLAILASVLQQQGHVVRVIDAQAECLDITETAALVSQAQPATLVVYTTDNDASTMIKDRVQDELSGVRWVRCPAGVDGNIQETVEAITGDIGSIDDRTWPDWPLFPLRHYAEGHHRGRLCLPISSSQLWDDSSALRTVDHVVDEWAYLIERCHANEVAVLDSAFLRDRERVETTCAQVRERGLHGIPWRAYADEETPADTDFMAALRDAGCVTLMIGADMGGTAHAIEGAAVAAGLRVKVAS